MKRENVPNLYGDFKKETITDEMIKALQHGKRLYLSINDEYAVVIKKGVKRRGESE